MIWPIGSSDSDLHGVSELMISFLFHHEEAEQGQQQQDRGNENDSNSRDDFRAQLLEHTIVVLRGMA